MGYLFLLIIGAAVVVALFVAFVGSKRRPAGKTMGAQDVTIKTPAADEPTPGASNTTSMSSQAEAQKKIPPA